MSIDFDDADLFEGMEDLFGEAEAEEGDSSPAEEPAAIELANHTASAIFDIETGPGPWEEIERFYEPLEKPGEFDPQKVKLGNASKPETVQKKIDEARKKHEAAIGDYEEAAAKHKEEFLANAAISPFTLQVLAIGYLTPGSPPKYTIVGDQKSEAQTLADFWRAYGTIRDANAQLIGLNIFRFDVPVLIQRTLYHGLPLPTDIEAFLTDPRQRSLPRLFVDLGPIFACKVYGKDYLSMDKLCRFFGLPGKNGNGAEFAGLWEKDRKKACEYLRNDLLMTYEIARKLRVLP